MNGGVIENNTAAADGNSLLFGNIANNYGGRMWIQNGSMSFSDNVVFQDNQAAVFMC